MYSTYIAGIKFVAKKAMLFNKKIVTDMSGNNFFSGKNIIVSKGHLVPPVDAHAKDWRPTEVKQSLYLTLKESMDRHLAEGGDWKWTVDFIREEEVTAKEAFKWANG